MDTLTSDDNLLKALLLENISTKCDEENNFQTVFERNQFEKRNIFEASINDCPLEEKYENEEDGDVLECNIEDCNTALNINKQIISSLLDLKRHVTFVLEKCEKKLAIIETSLQKHTVGDAKIIICNAGTPYFKDRDYFVPPNNQDELFKENRKELQLGNLPKVCSWTIKERETLVEAIKEEAITDLLSSRKTDDCTTVDEDCPTVDSTVKVKEETNKGEKMFPSMDLSEIVGPFKRKEFDWFKISSIHFDNIHSPLDCRVMWNVFLHPDINKNVWPKSEDIKLKEIVRKHKFQNWDKIAKDLSTNRTAYQCFIRYNTTKKLPKFQNYTWKLEEDERLLKLVDIFRIGDFIPWGEVANWIENRTKQQVYFRWTYSLSPDLIKGRFTKIEDRLLKDAVIKYGTNFRKISAALMPNRSTVQLHDRYQILINNQITQRRVWTLLEDSKLLALFARFGPNWSRIANAFSSKTRTQLRHRHTALQKYFKRGISLFDVHKNQLCDTNKRRKKPTTREEMSSSKEDDHENGNKNDNDNDDDTAVSSSTLDQSRARSNKHDGNDIETELIEYFVHIRSKATIFVRKNNKLYTNEQLSRDTKNLYAILQQLNAKLCIPDNIAANTTLCDRDQQLLHSLKEYAKLQNDTNKRYQLIDECSLRMFGTNHTKQEGKEEGSHRFVPPAPFDSQIKLTSNKSVENKCIDYNLNANNKFLVEKPVEMNTPDFVIAHIGGNEHELQFQKLSRSFRLANVSTGTRCCLRGNTTSRTRPTGTMFLSQQNNNNQSDTTSDNDRDDNKLLTNKCGSIVRSEYDDIAASSVGSLEERRRTRTRTRRDNSTYNRIKSQKNEHPTKSCVQAVQKRNYTLFTIPAEERVYTSSSSTSTETEITGEKDVVVIEATHATISSLQNLIHFKRFNERYVGSNHSLHHQSYKFQEATNLLETRLEQLFRYPIGLSKTALPEVYILDTNTIENTKCKRKSTGVSKMKKLR